MNIKRCRYSFPMREGISEKNGEIARGEGPRALPIEVLRGAYQPGVARARPMKYGQQAVFKGNNPPRLNV